MSESTTGECERCGGTGFLILEAAGVSRARPCACRAVPRGRPAGIEDFLQAARIPRRYHDCDFENFDAIPPHQLALQGQLVRGDGIEVLEVTIMVSARDARRLQKVLDPRGAATRDGAARTRPRTGHARGLQDEEPGAAAALALSGGGLAHRRHPCSGTISSDNPATAGTSASDSASPAPGPRSGGCARATAPSSRRFP